MAVNDLITPATTSQGTNYQYNGQSYNSMGQAVTAKNNLTTASMSPSAPVASPYVSQPNTPPPATTQGGGTSQYPVVTSQPATNQLNGIQSYYQGVIQPNSQNAAVNSANTANANNAQASLPTIDGYNVSATPTGNQGETKATNNATGQSYYITPQKPALTASDVQSIISGGGDTTNAPTATTAPTGGTPTDVATAQTGANPTTENQNYQNQVQGITDQLTGAYNTFQSTINSLNAGAIPFTSAQQSLIDATNQAFNQMTQNAELKGAALSSQFGGVSNKINATLGDLTNINAQQAAAIAKMEVGFQTENFNEKYKIVTDAYAAFKDMETQKMDALTKIHTAVMDTYQKAVDAATAQRTYELDVQKFNETTIKDAQTLAQSKYEFRDLKDAMGNTIGTQVFDKSTGHVVGQTGNGMQASGATVPTVMPGANGLPDPKSQANFLSTIPQPYQSLVQGIANGKIEPPSARTAKSAQILAWVAQYDPTLSDGSGGFDATKYQARLTMQKGLASNTSGSLGAAVVSANKVIAHLATFFNDSTSLPKLSPFGSFTNSIATNILGGIAGGLGDTNIQSMSGQAQTAQTGVSEEMAKFFKGTGASDVGSINSWAQSINPNDPVGKIQGHVQGALDLFSGQLNAVINQYTTVMGKPPDLGTIIQPQTMATLSAFKDAGFKIDIPGVPYSSPTAYANASPDNKAELDAVRTHYPNLSPADALAQAQFNQSQGI